METHRRNNSCGDKFSFPIIPIEEHNFEFNSVPTPGSSTSPADTIFSNGKLLPHYFPTQPANYNTNSLSRSASRTSSVCSSSSSKDSLISSRSNSNNSTRSSSCSSARTSTSETALPFSSDRKLHSFDNPKVVNNNNRTPHGKDWQQAKNKPVLAQQQHNYYNSSQRWQFIAPAPGLNHQGSRVRRSSSSRQSSVREQEMKSKREAKDLTNARICPGRKILAAFVSACKDCHAMKPPSRKSVDENLEIS